MPIKRILVGVLAISWTLGLFASPIDELGSPVPEIRDAAAKKLRSASPSPAKTNWSSLVSKLKKGASATNVFALFPPNTQREAFVMGAGNSTASYRLDDHYILVCRWNDIRHTLLDFQLAEQLRHVWVQPPHEFTGVWTTYYVNGQVCSTINYQMGKYSGDFTSYRSDGTKAYVQHYGPRGCQGEEIGWYPSGKVFYKGSYTNGIQIGTWTWFNEDGTVQSVKEFTP